MLKVLLNDKNKVVGQTEKEGVQLAKELKDLSGGNGAIISKDGFASSTGENGTIEAIPKNILAEEYLKALQGNK